MIYLGGWWLDDLHLRRADLAITLNLLIVMLVVTLIKYAVRRRRPHPPGEFVSFGYDAYSFPSGHAARMAALAVGIVFFFPAFSWLGVGLALGVALARVAVWVHYVSDIVIGLAVGLAVTWVEIRMLAYLLALPTF
jgi:undecaprenyl-diphosphatase